ncbi:MAG: hypothetical protein U1E27_00840 [Kiritimatiellia bacterium]|nr:hypothetical protein [Kiritimatiellia bacterium]
MSVLFREWNRPPHLARRDAAVERAVESIFRPVQTMSVTLRMSHVEYVLTLLQAACAHADRALRSRRTTEREREFSRFLDLILQNVKSVNALVKNQAHFESETACFLSGFLRENAEEALLSASNYQRRSEDMLHGLWQILSLSHAPYRALQEENLAGLTEEERERYHRGFACYREAFRALDPIDRQTVET